MNNKEDKFDGIVFFDMDGFKPSKSFQPSMKMSNSSPKSEILNLYQCNEIVFDNMIKYNNEYILSGNHNSNEEIKSVVQKGLIDAKITLICCNIEKELIDLYYSALYRIRKEFYNVYRITIDFNNLSKEIMDIITDGRESMFTDITTLNTSLRNMYSMYSSNDIKDSTIKYNVDILSNVLYQSKLVCIMSTINNLIYNTMRYFVYNTDLPTDDINKDDVWISIQDIIIDRKLKLVDEAARTIARIAINQLHEFSNYDLAQSKDKIKYHNIL